MRGRVPAGRKKEKKKKKKTATCPALHGLDKKSNLNPQKNTENSTGLVQVDAAGAGLQVGQVLAQPYN
jgi:hypothetical protein